MAPTILITGSEGNIGTYVCESIRKTIPAARIIRVSHTTRPSEENLFIGDLRDSEFVKRLFKEVRPDYVLHLAAQRYSMSGFRNAAFTLLDNDTSCLLNVLKEAQSIRKFVYLSSALVYESAAASPLSEVATDTIAPPKSSYGFTKIFGEKAVRLFSEQYGVPYTIWRPFNVVSPLEPHDGDGHVFVDFFRQLFIEKVPELQIHGSGAQIRCFTWVEDVAYAIATFLEDERSDNKIFNIGGQEPTNLMDLANLMLRLGHDKAILPVSYIPRIYGGGSFDGVDSLARVPSLDALETTLGWVPNTGLRECFSKFIDYKMHV